MKFKKNIIIPILIILIILLFQMIKDFNNYLKDSNLSLADWYWNFSYIESNSSPLMDNPFLYTDDDTKIYDIYIIILPTLDEDGNNISFEYLNSIKDFTVAKPELNAYLVNIDSKNIESMPKDENPIIPNAKITLRGHSTMESEQKSYKIRLNEESFLGHNVLNLNKHPFDGFRLRNKIAFELFEDIPNIVSMQTNLVNLYIKDMTNGGTVDFIDYGLFTNIEQANKQFLKAHELDREGHLYKAEEFEFFRYEENIRNISDPLYEESNFAEILEPKVGKDHQKIIRMLDDVNNYNLDINKILDKHFNRDNYYTWLAVNILLGNYDTRTQNFFLYSPRDTLAWYFLPWDYDGSMGAESSVFQGVANYWNSILHQRVFKDPNNLLELNSKIEEIYSILSKEKIENLAIKYKEIVEREYSSDPLYREEYKLDEFNKQIEYISNSTRNNRKLYYEDLEKPMPIYLGEVEKIDSEYFFYWGESFDLQGDRLSYTFEISKTIDFNQIVFEKSGIRDTEMTLNLEAGEYYWRVIVVDSKGNSQKAFDEIVEEDNRRYYGLKHIILD